MPPSESRSPRRRKVRRYLSATGTRWIGRAPSSVSSSSQRRRGSFASTGRFTPHHSDSEHEFGEDGACLDDDDDDDDAGSVASHPETYTLHVHDDDRRPLAYSSLPSTPISSPRPHPLTPPHRLPSLPSVPTRADYDPLPVPHHEHRDDSPDAAPPFSIWDYLREELLATDFDSHQELKWERVSNFLSMPVAIEKVRTPHVCAHITLIY